MVQDHLTRDELQGSTVVMRADYTQLTVSTQDLRSAHRLLPPGVVIA
jgi:hypothetical protein